MRVGICGLGGFGQTIASTMQLHEDVLEIVGAERNEEQRLIAQRKLKLTRVVATMDELCDSNVDAIAIFTPPWLHARHAIQAMKAGKHVLCAIPAALNMEDLIQVLNTVRDTGKVYMTAETSYYYPDVIYCRELHKQGRFGDIVFARAAYSYSPDYSKYNFWKRDYYGNLPSMLYVSHSTARVLGTVGSRFTKVTAHANTRLHPEVAVHKRLPHFETNVFSNMSARMVMENGCCSEINEFRYVGFGDEMFSIYGTEALYSNNETANKTLCSGGTVENLEWLFDPYQGARFPAELDDRHPHKELLSQMPEPRGADWGSSMHAGSHPFLVHEFIRCCKENKLPINNIWMAAKYNAPGIMAYQSILEEGAWMDIQHLGEPAPDANLFSWDE
ncbi:Gfo/Idh/MocA family protein [Paenibacillus sp. GCM10023252]|uniref:Gfo/Idh/MocA family protein n=1 Tax=Paenibacillus sp. GCM10023252 TaxID=3252649 RepID=UPI00360CD37D